MVQIHGIRTKDCAFGRKSYQKSDVSLMKTKTLLPIVFSRPHEATKMERIGEMTLFLRPFAVRDVAFWSE